MSMSIEECQTPRPGFPKPVPAGPSNVIEQFSMKGKVIVVTGAAEGIGGAVADAMAEAGGNVALWYNSYVRNQSRSDNLLTLLATLKPRSVQSASQKSTMSRQRHTASTSQIPKPSNPILTR
jgi:predicted Rossmann-fold nucleotide-binding protein